MLPSPGSSTRSALLGLLVLLLVGGCTPGGPLGEPEPPLPPVQVELVTDQEEYRPFEPVRLTLILRNEGVEEVTLPFPTAQRHDLLVRDEEGRVLWRWSDGRSFAQVEGEESLAPGQVLEWRGTFEGTGRPGTYTAEGGLVGPLSGLRADASFQVEDGGR